MVSSIMPNGRVSSSLLLVCGIAGAMALVAISNADVPWAQALLAASVSLMVMSVILAFWSMRSRRGGAASDAILREIHADDPDPVALTDTLGTVLWHNQAAVDAGISLQSDGGDVALSPERIATLLREALETGRASATDLGAPGARLSLHKAGQDRVVWRWTPAAPSQDGEVWKLRADDDGNILWVSPALVSQMGDVPVHLDELVVSPPMRNGLLQDLRVGEGRVARIPMIEAVGDELSEITLLADGQDDSNGQFDWLPIPLLELSANGTIVRSNQPVRNLLSFEPNEEVGLQHLVEGLGRPVVDWLADAFHGMSQPRSEVMRASRVSSEFYVQVTLNRVERHGKPKLLAVLQDATELKTLEAQFVQSQKMQAIGQLAGGVAHDFNNLLTAISGHCDFLLLRHDAGDQDFADLEQISQNANRAASLVGQLLAFSRKQNLRFELLDLRLILADLTHLLNRLVGERVNLRFNHDPALQMVRADKRQLEQVIMNLVVNARDAMPDGGSVEIRTRMRHLETIEAHDRVDVPAGDYVLVEVADQGIGIDPDKLHKIFEPFFTTKRAGEGTGLGLSTAYGIVKQTGGYIFARPNRTKGTIFTLYLPATTQRAQPRLPEQKAIEARTPPSEGRILLVEDEAPVRAFAARALRMRGHDVVEAPHAEAALKILQDPKERFDVFVSDVIMPGKDGPTWVRAALRERPDVRVVFVSGYAEESFAESQASLPNSIFLPKPFSLADLTKTVETQLKVLQ